MYASVAVEMREWRSRIRGSYVNQVSRVGMPSNQRFLLYPTSSSLSFNLLNLRYVSVSSLRV